LDINRLIYCNDLNCISNTTKKSLLAGADLGSGVESCKNIERFQIQMLNVNKSLLVSYYSIV